MYFSFATLDSIASIIFIVVFTPTSEVIRISSNSSKTSTSTFDLPTTAFLILSKKELLVFSKLLFKLFLFVFFNNLLKKPSLFSSSGSGSGSGSGYCYLTVS